MIYLSFFSFFVSASRAEPAWARDAIQVCLEGHFHPDSCSCSILVCAPPYHWARGLFGRMYFLTGVVLVKQEGSISKLTVMLFHWCHSPRNGHLGDLCSHHASTIIQPVCLAGFVVNNIPFLLLIKKMGYGWRWIQPSTFSSTSSPLSRQ